jgi:hypothetical protein
VVADTCGGGGRGAGWANLGRGAAAHTNNMHGVLNTDANLDASDLLNGLLTEDENVSQFFLMHIKSSYHDTDTFIQTHRNTFNPIFLSINIQSLNSKYESLKILIHRFLS